MNFGTRQIRTSGKGSGSIELTLPYELRDLVGLPCRITLRDGSRPEIVLQPDLGRAVAGFTRVWTGMVAVMLPEHAEVSLPVGAFAFGLQPGVQGGERPYLCWRDGLALGAAPPHDPLIVARTGAAFAQVLADRLGIAASLAGDFGASCGFLATGMVPMSGVQEICDVVAGALPVSQRPSGPPASLTDPGAAGAAGTLFWETVAARLAACTDLFAHWTAHPAELAALRGAWQRGFSIEMTGG
jgi:hypothetical protein